MRSALALFGIIALVSLITGAAAAPSAPDLHWAKNGAPAWATPADIEAAKRYRHLAMYIDSRTEAEEGSRWRYTALTQVVRAAGVQVHSPLSPAEKEQVRQMWVRFEEKGLLVCNNLQFDVANGSVLKFAVSSLFDPFVYFCGDLKLGLTRVDETDDRTILDYPKYRINSQSPGPV